MSRPLHKEGGCLVFAWGPPWNWLPSFQRSRHHIGWSLTWLWWGLSYVPVSSSTLMIDGVYPRCQDCKRHTILRLCADCAGKRSVALRVQESETLRG